jgi:putative transposase
MGQSLVKNYLHITFSTKHRQPLIFPPFEDELHQYLGGICKKLECPVLNIGGYFDHVHIFCMLSKKIALMKLIEEVKSNSSRWMKKNHESLSHFYWQDGYGAFSVNPKGVDRVTRYISTQHEHHQKTSYQDEFRGLLRLYNIEWDERYVWD